MSYILRDRSDGQVEILFSRPILVGVFSERDIAERVCAFLKDDEPELPPDEPDRFSTAVADVSELEALSLADAETQKPARPQRRRKRHNLPALVQERPQAPVMTRAATPHSLNDGQLQAAFARIQNGEKIHTVAVDFGLTMGQLRGMWANHKRRMQSFMAEGGQQACAHCQRPFTPSISNPDTCARCSNG